MEAFRFHTKADQTILLGMRAATIPELLEGVRTVPLSSIYYHTHHYLQQHQFLSPEPPNDFAYWVTEVLVDPVLGEELSSIDIVQCSSIRELQGRCLEILSAHGAGDHPSSRAPEGHEFHFMASRTFVLPTPFIAQDLPTFVEALLKVSVASLYYHMFDAKLRLERGENDFSRWLAAIGKRDLADAIRSLDPYTHTLEGLRKRILVIARGGDGH
jgi:hypothetical protein